MKPIGLTLKNIRINPYTKKISGEIMLVHLCLACGKVSCNRVAGDDNSYSVISLLSRTEELNAITLAKLSDLNVQLLSSDDERMVSIALMGNSYD